MKHKQFIREHMVKSKPAISVNFKIKLSMILFFMFSLINTRGQELYVTEKKNNQDVYNFNELNKLSFSAGNIFVSLTDNSSENYALSDLRCLSFTDLGIGTNSISQKTTGNTIELFPNPVKDILHVKLTGSENKKTKLEIFSVDGKKVYSRELNPNLKTHQISLPVFTKGVYVCKIKNRTIKFIKY